VLKSTEPICFDHVKNERYELYKNRPQSGAVFLTAHGTNISADMENMHKNLIALIHVRGQGCIYDNDGEVLPGIPNVLGMVDNFHTVKGQSVIP
jgi:hypothetical protein